MRYCILQDDLMIKVSNWCQLNTIIHFTIQDVKTIAMNDVEFFVFEDILLQVREKSDKKS